MRRYVEIFLVSLKLGLTSFGGPTAHLGYFQEEYIRKKRWLDDQRYAEIIAICQFLPGPASSQVGIAIGMMRGGMLGGFLSWFGFTMPSVVILMLFALLLQHSSFDASYFIYGLKITAVAVVAHALSQMSKQLTPDKGRKTIAIASAICILLYPTAIGQIAVILIAGVAGVFIYKEQKLSSELSFDFGIGKKSAALAWLLFFGLLILLPLGRESMNQLFYSLFDTFFRAGSIVFGGGHVVMPMLEREVVPSGWMTEETFLAGYGMAQAVPGPLFTLSAYLGTAASGVAGGLLATVAIFLPSFLLLIGTLPFWGWLRQKSYFQASLMGINSAVVGILLAALYDPVFTSAVKRPLDLAFVLLIYAAIVIWKLPVWKMVLGVLSVSLLFTVFG
ncbi:chromate efflux transporter [Bacillus sp. REN10]|uniref:chromate efflux transporter n=1 Tax=Bacillus sp. REN10 TaxID=2782541 RepID=UPI00193C5CC1|nr:chromate efflux transporter [Bacillus sp. REN10]